MLRKPNLCCVILMFATAFKTLQQYVVLITLLVDDVFVWQIFTLAPTIGWQDIRK